MKSAACKFFIAILRDRKFALAETECDPLAAPVQHGKNHYFFTKLILLVFRRRCVCFAERAPGVHHGEAIRHGAAFPHFGHLEFHLRIDPSRRIAHTGMTKHRPAHNDFGLPSQLFDGQRHNKTRLERASRQHQQACGQAGIECFRVQRE